MTAPKILALDFDGVVCDTARELLMSAWHVYRAIWGGAGDDPPPQAADAYLRLRPVLEIGWESPVLLRAILEGVPEASLLREFQTTWRPRIVEAHGLDQADLSARIDAARDAWIRRDLPGWLASNHGYPGIADRLRTILAGSAQLFILTTKEGRFARLLLERSGVNLPAGQVWGKELARPKAELLRALHRAHAVDYAGIWFVEDRLKTLQAVDRQADLKAVGLFLATWGYNTPAEREEARAHGRIVSLTPDQFCEDFPVWTRPQTDQTVSRGATP